MKTLNNYITEKLVINKNFKKFNDDLEKIKKLKWIRDNEIYYKYKDIDIYTLFCDYIENEGTPVEDRFKIIEQISYPNDKYFAAFNKDIRESLVFYHNAETDLYEKISLFVDIKLGYCYIYRMDCLKQNSVQPLNNNSVFNRGHSKYFNITFETYNNVVKMFEEIKKNAIHN